MTKRNIRSEDIFSIRLLGDVEFHPTKPLVATTITELDEKENTYRTHIWLVPTDGSGQSECAGARERLFTNSAKNESSPKWSPDGNWMAFLSNRNGDHNQVFVMPASGGEAIQVTSVEDGVHSFRWSPNGLQIAFIASVDKTKLAHKDDESPRYKFTKDVKRIRRSFYKLDGVGFFGDARDHLHVIDVTPVVAGNYSVPKTDDERKALFNSLQVTDGEFDIETFEWAPDSSRIAVVTNVYEDAEYTFKKFIYTLTVPAVTGEGNGPVPVSDMHNLTPEFHSAGTMKWSPDGQEIAFRGENHQFGPNTQAGIYTVHVETGEIRWLTEGKDELFENRSIADTRSSTTDAIAWSKDGSAVFSLMSTRGTVQLVRIDKESGELTRVTDGQHCVLSYSFSGSDEEIALHVGTGTDVANVYLHQVGGENENSLGKQLTDINKRFYEEVEVLQPKRFTFTNDDTLLDGWVLLPKNSAPQGGYPAVLQVHGGPAMMYSESFFFEFQLIAASGIAVVYTNPRGGSGYGQDFVSCVEMDWGNLDYKDVEAGMDAALAKFNLDKDRLGIAGGSYGGFMSAWAIGHTKRYKAAVVMRAVINWYSEIAADVGFSSPAEEFKGVAPWEDVDRYLRISPITYAGDIEAHTLIIHSEQDYRCPIDQGEQLYIALRLRGVPVEFLRFPEESHGLSRNGKPWHRIARLEAIDSFLAKELGAAE